MLNLFDKMYCVQNLSCAVSTALMYVAVAVCVCVCVHVCKRVMLQTSTKMHGLRSEVVEKHDRFLS